MYNMKPVHGDPELAARLGALVGRRARSVATVVVDVKARARFAFIGADADTRFEMSWGSPRANRFGTVDSAGTPTSAPRGWSTTGRRPQPWTMDGYAQAGAACSG
jgi:hypothetical protein